MRLLLYVSIKLHFNYFVLINYYYNLKLIFYLCNYSKEYHLKKNDKIYTYWYKCSQDRSLAKRPRKNENEEKNRDKIPNKNMERT